MTIVVPEDMNTLRAADIFESFIDDRYEALVDLMREHGYTPQVNAKNLIHIMKEDPLLAEKVKALAEDEYGSLINADGQNTGVNWDDFLDSVLDNSDDILSVLLGENSAKSGQAPIIIGGQGMDKNTIFLVGGAFLFMMILIVAILVMNRN